MIGKITQKKYRSIKWSQRNQKKSDMSCLVFKGADGKYYYCDKGGWRGTKELVEYNKQLKAQMDTAAAIEQSKLI